MIEKREREERVKRRGIETEAYAPPEILNSMFLPLMKKAARRDIGEIRQHTPLQ